MGSFCILELVLHTNKFSKANLMRTNTKPASNHDQWYCKKEQEIENLTKQRVEVQNQATQAMNELFQPEWFDVASKIAAKDTDCITWDSYIVDDMGIRVKISYIGGSCYSLVTFSEINEYISKNSC